MIVMGGIMDCKHKWELEQLDTIKIYSCKKCGATKLIDRRGIIHLTDANGNFIQNADDDGEKALRQAERDLADTLKEEYYR
ncbi:MAG: hypothetical protein J6K32_10390 [Clostridia bacterium]|nr:hypothetical protein [Clostridia bacterium]